MSVFEHMGFRALLKALLSMGVSYTKTLVGLRMQSLYRILCAPLQYGPNIHNIPRANVGYPMLIMYYTILD